MLVELDEEKETTRLKLRGGELLKDLMVAENEYKKKITKTKPETSWKPEYGRYMIEVTPFGPYSHRFENILDVEDNMEKRREEAKRYLKKNEYMVGYSSFPLMGAVEEFTQPGYKAGGCFANSRYLPDEIINEHIRFGTLTRNIRTRKGTNVCILAPLFMDENTDPDIGVKVPWTNEKIEGIPQYSMTPSCCSKFIEQKKPAIFMDAMGFGMGNSCLQCTYQMKNIKQGRKLYDQLVPWAPIMLSLTAATPVLRGLLAETDARWYSVSASVDDRTAQEQGEILKSRYDSVSLYISPENKKYNNLEKIKINQEAYDRLIKQPEFDDSLATHFAHLMVRDPLVIFSDYDKINDCEATDHFENVQSTNWQSIRFKPPPTPYDFESINGKRESEIGWRVEFRVMEINLTSFENAAFAQFMWLWSKILIEKKYNFILPICDVDVNMCSAHFKDSVIKKKFLIRTNYKKEQAEEEPKIEKLSINDIMSGNDTFVGIIPLMKDYLKDHNVEGKVYDMYETYLNFVADRASGELETTAHYIRRFILEHPEYKKDSRVTEKIAFDLTKHVIKISDRQIVPNALLGNYLTIKE